MSDDLGLTDEFFIFVNRAAFWTRHNFDVTGCFISAGFGAAFPDQVPVGTVAGYGPGPQAPVGVAVNTAYDEGSLDYLQFVPNPNYFGWPTPFADSVQTNLRVEYDAEVTRRADFPTAPSRLSAVYAFGDYATCEQVHRSHRWSLSEVQAFRIEPHDGNRIIRVNMGVVSLARTAYPRAMWGAQELYNLWSAYWSGQTAVDVEVPIDGINFERLNSGCIWEYLIEGKLVRTGT